MKLKELREHWEGLLINPYAFWQKAWLPSLDPANRVFFVACWKSLRATSENPLSIIEEVEGWTELLDKVEKMPALQSRVTAGQIKSFKFQLEYLRLTSDRPFATKPPRVELEELAVHFGRPLGTALDLEYELSQTPEMASRSGPHWDTTGSLLCGRLRPAAHRVTGPALLELKSAVEGIQQVAEVPGKVASLTLEWVWRDDKSLPGGAGNIYHVPALDFVTEDQQSDGKFQKALSMALESLERYGLVLTDADVRYRLALRGINANQILSRLSGPSLCRAFELALLKLFSLVAPEKLPRTLASVADVALGGIAVTAAFAEEIEKNASAEPSPQLWCPVGGLLPKLIAAARTTFPAIHTVLVAKDQSIDEAALDQGRDVGFGQLQVLKAANLKDALDELGKKTQFQWARRTAGLPEPPKVNIVRTKLLNSIDDLIHTTDAGFIEITGEMGRGKSTALSQIVHQGLDSAFVGAHFFIGRAGADSVKPDSIARSLYAQLLESHAYKEKIEWEKWEAHQKLAELLKEIGAQLKENGRKEVLLIDGADQFESDGGTFLVGSVGHSNCILSLLPSRVFCVVSTRPDKHAWRAPGVPMEPLAFDKLVDEQEDEFLMLSKRNQQLAPPLSREFLQEIVDVKPLPAMLALDRRLASLEANISGEEELREQLRKRVEEWRIPPRQFIKADLELVIAHARKMGISAQRTLFILGIHVCAGRPITLKELKALDDAAGQKLKKEERLWDDKDSKIVLQRAANFFEGNPLEDSDRPFRFYHDGYKEAIESIEVEVEDETIGPTAKAAG